MNHTLDSKTICITGLGYVGLPLAHAFSKHLNVIGYDVDDNRINNLKKEFEYFVNTISNGDNTYTSGIDGRNVVDADGFIGTGFIYEGIERGDKNDYSVQ